MPPALRLSLLLPLLLLGAFPAQGQQTVETPTRQPDAYNAWKLALGGGTATDPKAITVPEGFAVELLRSALPEEDSWVSMAFDPEGRLTIGCEKKGLLRMTLAAAGVAQVERIEDTLLECRGLLYAHGALYAVANNSKVLVRLRSTRGDGQFDEVKELLRTEGGVGHGRNHVKLGPDGMLYLVHGNNVVAPPEAFAASPLRRMQDDRLIPCPWDPKMFDGDVKLPAGHILRGDAEGKNWTLLAGGLRNPLDVAFNEAGEMFTFDADMEWDTGTPWYRPTRVNHIIAGADFGWRRGTSKWPGYFPDSGPTPVDIGLSSPTAVLFGNGAAFPRKWREALYICDWAYGRIIAVHLRPEGASYTGTAEAFVTGKPLNVTDAAVGPDGHMYFVTGGRRTQPGLYRLRYVGLKVEEKESAPGADGSAEARALRRTLEESAYSASGMPLNEIWPHLGSSDRWIRHAARIALEARDASEWREGALAEKQINASLTALMALAHCGDNASLRPMLERLHHLPFAALNEEQQILALRDYQLAMIRLGPLDDAARAECAKRLDPLYPARSWQANHLLCELLVHLQAPSALPKTLVLLAQAEKPEDLLHYLLFLRNVPQGWSVEDRRVFFTALNRAEPLEGARDYQRSLALIRSEVAAVLTEAERAALGAMVDRAIATPPVQNTGPQVVVKEWKAEELVPRLDRVSRGRSFDSGKAAFATAQCAVCHRLGKTGGLVGPELNGVGGRFNRRDLLDSILHPSRVIDDKYRSTSFELKSGATVIGTIESEDENNVYVRVNPAAETTTPLPKATIARREPSPISPMPPGLLNVLTEPQIFDLLAYLESGGDPRHADFSN
jgi:putative heme-binding domain-containing protein